MLWPWKPQSLNHVVPAILRPSVVIPETGFARAFGEAVVVQGVIPTQVIGRVDEPQA